jgi:HAD superfamily hydrolase (TIGR01509 family)
MPVFLSREEVEEFGDELEELRADIYTRSFLPHAQAFPKVRELFERIRRDGKRIALASSAPEDELEFYKKLTSIEDLLDDATSADDAERSKPEPDIFVAAVAKLEGVEAADCIVVGDTPYDAEAAGKAGMRTIGVLCGGFSEESLRGAGCIEIYRDPSELLNLYEKTTIGRPESPMKAT